MLHSSGVMRYYEQAWAPGSSQQPRRSLLVSKAEAVECHDDMLSAQMVKWPSEATVTRRLAVVFPQRSYIL